MEIKVNQINNVQAPSPTTQTNASDGTFKFTLASHIEESQLQERLQSLMESITMEGEKIKKRKDLRDVKHYKGLIKEFLNEVVSHSHSFTRENFLDRRGRHRVYGIIRLIDENLDELTKELMKDEKDSIQILEKIGEIRGLLLDIFT